MRTIFVREWTGGRGTSFTTAHLRPKDAGTFRAKHAKTRFTSTPGALMKVNVPKVEYDKLIAKMGNELGVKVTLPLSL